MLVGYFVTTVRSASMASPRGLRWFRGRVAAQPQLYRIGCAFEVDQPTQVVGVVDVRMRGVFLDEGVGRIARRFLLVQLVVGVDDVEPRLPRLGRERIARGQRLVVVDRFGEVVGAQCAPAAVVEFRGRVFRQLLELVLVGGAAGEQDEAQRNEQQRATGGVDWHHVSIDAMNAPASLLELSVTLPGCPAGQRLDQALALVLPQYSRSRLAAWIKDGSVALDGRPARPRDSVYGGEQVVLRATVVSDERVAAEPMSLVVRHRDAHVFVIDKPAGLVVHPGAGNRAHTLQNGLLALDPKLAQVPRAGIVHRIDKDTSGLLVVARTLEAHTALVEALHEHEVQREYLALCVGAVTGGGTIDKPIDRHRTDRLRMAGAPMDARPSPTTASRNAMRATRCCA